VNTQQTQKLVDQETPHRSRSVRLHTVVKQGINRMLQTAHVLHTSLLYPSDIAK